MEMTTKGKDLAKNVVSILLKKKLKITIAESCTGGLLSNMITNIPVLLNVSITVW